MRLLLLLAALALAGGWMHLRAEAPQSLHPDDPRSATGKTGIVMLAAEWCGYCRRQQAEFAAGKVRYRVLDIDTPDGARAMQALGARGVPVTVIGQTVIRGYDTAALAEHLEPLGYPLY
ncbi:NrdH-redoxin [Lysobacteraceae bacterium NML93-0792]|nr:NrdH-redoxin [Xanthomonadaceae bacterium NML93-0792]PBS17071.1 NrdH-redoxin [Xanthomonadaceae bacterium NML93-0793]PBS19675.1 NrdH-redoxin [Xanthomonadaceae bacterium NML93-0831]